MGFENQETNLVITDLDDNIKPTVTYIAGGVRTIFGLKRFTVTSEDIDKLVALAVTYIAENNSASSTNHSSLTIE